jgi:hypothetical protein
MLERMSEGHRSIDFVACAAADAPARDRSRGFEIREDLEDRTFGDSDEFGKVAHPRLGLARYRNEYVRMVAQECPGRTRPRLDVRHGSCYLLHEIKFM